MITYMRMSLVQAGAALVLLTVAAIPSRAAPAAGEGWDTEISCCFLFDDFRQGGEYESAFVIEVAQPDRHAVELKLTTPDGAVVGFDEKTNHFTRPNPAEGAYGLLVISGIDLIMAGPDWRNDASRAIALYPTSKKGQYTLQVIGVQDGRYDVIFYPIGLGQPQPGSGVRPASFELSTSYVPIRAGEIHTYVFPGEFDRKEWNFSPTRFYFKRIR